MGIYRGSANPDPFRVGVVDQTRLIIKNKADREVTVLFADSNTGATYRDVQCIVNDDPDISQFMIYRVGNDESAEDSFFENVRSIIRRLLSWTGLIS